MLPGSRYNHQLHAAGLEVYTTRAANLGQPQDGTYRQQGPKRPRPEGLLELEMWERRKRAEDASRICGITHEEAEMGNLMHQDEQELLSLWEGRHWDDSNGGWLDLEPCAKARREQVEYIRRHKMYTRVSREACLRETGKAPMGGD